MSAAQNCQHCGKTQARQYEQYVLAAVGQAVEPEIVWLCAKCARQERQQRKTAPPAEMPPGKISREELIAALDDFWAASGALEICRRCHEQGTGCCPPMCRYLSATGCERKNVFCTGFVCSALLNAIAECDAETGRIVKWIKTTLAPVEYRLYEMITRVPAIDREKTRPLTLPEQYPALPLLAGATLKNHLLALTEEVLAIRQNWHQAEKESVISQNPPTGLVSKS